MGIRWARLTTTTTTTATTAAAAAAAAAAGVRVFLCLGASPGNDVLRVR